MLQRLRARHKWKERRGLALKELPPLVRVRRIKELPPLARAGVELMSGPSRSEVYRHNVGFRLSAFF